MLTVMCPNCRHRFPAPGCCNPGPQGTIVANNEERNSMVGNSDPMRTNDRFYGGDYLLVPREFSEINRGCFINAPTIIHGPTIIQQPSIFNKSESSFGENEAWIKSFGQHRPLQGSPSIAKTMFDGNVDDGKSLRTNEFTDCHIDTNCHLSGGTVTIRRANIQSGDCLLRSKDAEIILQSPRIEIRPKLSGGGCCVEKDVPIEATNNENPIYRNNDRIECSIDEKSCSNNCKYHESVKSTPSGCRELPGTRRFSAATRKDIENREIMDDAFCKNDCNFVATEDDGVSKRDWNNRNETRRNSWNTGNETKKRNSICQCGNDKREDSSTVVKNLQANSSCPIVPGVSSSESVDGKKKFASNETSGPMEIRVNATVQLPANVGHCTVNITATTENSKSIPDSTRIVTGRRDNFNGGGLINLDSNNSNETIIPTNTTNVSVNNDRREDAPTTPLSWLMPCPWGFDNYPIDKDVNKLSEIKRLLQISGWYHEGLKWQESETLLKNAPIGHWLMRDSSDSRFIFAVSVQTTRGPTSVRVHYVFGKFRLDAEPRLSLAMPLFECPIKMLQYYVDYSKRIDEHRKEVWVNYSGQLYSQIYLTRPLVKEVQTLSHLARIVVNSNKLNTDNLPPLIKRYLAEYPYSL